MATAGTLDSGAFGRPAPAPAAPRTPWGPHHVAAVILEQLGGRQFLAMTGPGGMTYGERCLCLAIGRNPRRIWKVWVGLTDRDLYEMRFFVRDALGVRLVGEALDVHAEDLQRVFTIHTGLDCHL